MTNEELLQKINDRLNECTTHDYAPANLAIALRAVVELHKPIPDMKSGFDQCSVCLTAEPFEVWHSDYPCPTIQAIEKKLQ